MIFEQLCRRCGYFPFNPNVKIMLASYLGLSVRQIERYINGENIHPSAKRLLEIKAAGMVASEHWTGFKIRQHELVTPTGETWQVNELKTKSLFLQLAKCANER